MAKPCRLNGSLGGHGHWQLSLLLSKGASIGTRRDYEGKTKRTGCMRSTLHLHELRLKVRQQEHVNFHNKDAQQNLPALRLSLDCRRAGACLGETQHTSPDIPRGAFDTDCLIRCPSSGNEIPGMAEISQCYRGCQFDLASPEKNVGTVCGRKGKRDPEIGQGDGDPYSQRP